MKFFGEFSTLAGDTTNGNEMPMEQMPTLEIDGKVYHQTRAISRYLAKQFELYKSDGAQAIEIDMYVNDVQDWREFYTVYLREDEPTRKAKLLEIAHEKTLWFLAKFEGRVETMVSLLSASEALSNIAQKDFIKYYPALQKANENVRSHPKIKAYLEKRPKTML